MIKNMEEVRRNKPVIRWIGWPEAGPLIQRMCVVLEEDPPELHPVDLVSDARRESDRLGDIVRPTFSLMGNVKKSLSALTAPSRTDSQIP
ncbi:hypothetical protein ACLOJK_030507 [Asimina triloba]